MARDATFIEIDDRDIEPHYKTLNVTISECCRSHPGELDKPEARVPRRQSGSRR